MQKLTRILAVVGLAALALIGGLSITAHADVVGPVSDSAIVTLNAGTTSYTNTTTNLTTQNVAAYGSVQLHLGVDVTDTQAVTATLFWSNDPAATCASATSFYTGTEIVRETSVFTGGVYTYTNTPLVQQLVASGGDVVVGREWNTQGRCLRVQLGWGGGTFTPTAWLRMVDRQE